MNKIIYMLLSLFFISSLSVQAQEYTTFYGPPYYNTSTASYSGHPSNTVSGAIENWWTGYQAYWHVSSCTYILTEYENGTETGIFAHMQLTNGCTGDDVIRGTAVAVEQEKNFGPVPCQ